MKFERVQVPEMPLPPGLPPDGDGSDLRVVALQAAARSYQAAPGEPSSKVHREVLNMARRYLDWLEQR